MPDEASLLQRVAAIPTAVWLDSVQTVDAASRALDAAEAEQRRTGQPQVTVLVVYDLPGRDCSASASGGDLAASLSGEGRYRTEFIDRIAAAFEAHPHQRIAAVVEPDSLANIATNLGTPKCAAAEAIYRRSVAYAVRALARNNVALYLDAAHAGWLGWSGNRAKFVAVVADVLAEAGGADKIRGFATNVANYDTLDAGDLPRLEPSDPATGELSYVQLLDESLSAAGLDGKAFVIDTSRNGRAGIRSRAGSWCNVRGAGLGERPRANPAPLVDAYLWIKPPGESDGATDSVVPGFDPQCGGPDAPDSAPGAPRAGQWFHSYFVQLARNASPPLTP